MKTILSFSLFLFAITLSAQAADIEKLKAAYGAPEASNPNLRKLYIYSKNELSNVYISVNNQYYQALSNNKRDDYFIYSTSVIFQPYLGKANLVSAYVNSAKVGIVETIETTQDTKTLELSATSVEQVVKTAEQLAAEAAEAQRQAQVYAQQMSGGDPSGFIGMVNAARAAQSALDRIVRPMLAWDQNLANWASRNSAAGYGHSVMGPASRQGCAISGSTTNAFNQWRGSATHNSYLMEPGMTRLGLGVVGNVWTFNMQ